MIEAWRVFPALTGVERAAFLAVNWGGTAEVIRSLVQGFGGLIFLSVKRDCNIGVRFMGQESRPEGFRIAVAAWQYVLDHKKKEIYHGKRKEISTGHYVYG